MKLTCEQILRIRRKPEALKAAAEDSHVRKTADVPDDQLSGDDLELLGEELAEMVGNEAENFEERLMNTSNSGGKAEDEDTEQYPVRLNGFAGLYFVDALEYDPVGFFDSLEDAQNDGMGEYREWFLDEEEDVNHRRR